MMNVRTATGCHSARSPAILDKSLSDPHLSGMDSPQDFEDLASRLRACRICRDAPRYGAALPHEPRPIVQGSVTARLCIASQAPGTRAHASGIPFDDRSGTRLREWLGLDKATFYDASKVAIVPMGSCFPGQDSKGGDLGPRRECAEAWRRPLFQALPNLDLVLLIGQYAQAWHLRRRFRGRADGDRPALAGAFSAIRRSRASCRCRIRLGATTAGSRKIPGSRPSCCPCFRAKFVRSSLRQGIFN